MFQEQSACSAEHPERPAASARRRGRAGTASVTLAGGPPSDTARVSTMENGLPPVTSWTPPSCPAAAAGAATAPRRQRDPARPTGWGAACRHGAARSVHADYVVPRTDPQHDARHARDRDARVGPAGCPETDPVPLWTCATAASASTPSPGPARPGPTSGSGSVDCRPSSRSAHGSCAPTVRVRLGHLAPSAKPATIRSRSL